MKTWAVSLYTNGKLEVKLKKGDNRGRRIYNDVVLVANSFYFDTPKSKPIQSHPAPSHLPPRRLSFNSQSRGNENGLLQNPDPCGSFADQGFIESIASSSEYYPESPHSSIRKRRSHSAAVPISVKTSDLPPFARNLRFPHLKGAHVWSYRTFLPLWPAFSSFLLAGWYALLSLYSDEFGSKFHILVPALGWGCITGFYGIFLMFDLGYDFWCVLGCLTTGKNWGNWTLYHVWWVWKIIIVLTFLFYYEHALEWGELLGF